MNYKIYQHDGEWVLEVKEINLTTTGTLEEVVKVLQQIILGVTAF